MSSEGGEPAHPSVPPRGALKRTAQGCGKKADRLVELATALAAGINTHYGIDVPIHEVILPAAGMVWILAHQLAAHLKTEH